MSRAGFLLLALALAGCEAAPGRTGQKLVDQGYVLGSADAIKRLYWLKQALEAPRNDGPAGRIEYYTWNDTGVAGDGRHLAPESVAVPVFIPAPVPSGAHGP
jgi:hypothetical protein